MRWRLVLTSPLAAVDNMAFDEALLARARSSGETVFRVYAWASPTLSLGRNQIAHGIYDAARCRDAGVPVVRRLTGGRAVLHHREVTYSVTAPIDPSEPFRESYERINRLLLDGLRRIGVEAAVARPRERSPLPGPAPCFDEPSEGELVIGTRKLVGSAQWREDGALLQHGSILVHDDQPMIASLARTALPPPPPAATLAAALGSEPPLIAVATALFDAVRALADPDALELPADELRDATRLARSRYEDDAWTWRR